MSINVAFVGLGVMGYPMAGWLSRKGFQITVYNRTSAVADNWIAAYDGAWASTPAAAVSHASVVFVCVGNDEDVAQVVYADEGILAGIKSDTVIVDHTTTSAELAERIEQSVQKIGCHFIDAPISGGQQGAENGQLTVMCGGQKDVFERVRPIMDCYAKAVTLLGPVGSGQRCKMVNQICIAGLVQGLSEGLNFAQCAGLDAHQVIEVISQGAAQSWQMENRYKTMLAGDYEHGFAVQWMRKDLAIALEEAERNGSFLPITELVDQFYSEVQQMGGNRWDTSSLLARLQSQRHDDPEKDHSPTQINPL